MLGRVAGNAAFWPPAVSLALGVVLHAVLPETTPVADASTYDAIAAGLVGVGHIDFADLHWAIGGLGMRGFVFPILIAPLYAIAGHSDPNAVGWMQAIVLLPTTTACIYIAGREAFSRRAGLVAAWLFALWFPAVWHTMWGLTETLTDMLLSITLALAAATLARRTARLALCTGLVLGLLAISHSAFQALSWVMALAFAVHLLVYDRSKLRLVLSVLGGILVGWAPVTLAAAAFGLPHLGEGARGYGGGGGWSFWIGSRAETGFVGTADDAQLGDLSADGQLIDVGRRIDRGELHVEPHLLAAIRRKLAGPNPRSATLEDGDYYRAGFASLLETPEQWPAKLRLNAEALFLVPSDIGFYRPDPTRQTWFRGIWRPLSGALALLAALGLARVVIERRDRLILFVPVVMQAVLLMFFVVEHRYVIPLWSSMFLLAGVGAVALVDVGTGARGHHRRSTDDAT